MSRLRIYGTAIIAFAHVQFVSAAYEQLRFSSSLMNFECSDDFGFGCPAPSICAYDRLIQKHYCCIPGNSDGICWTPSENCGGGNSSLPSGSQIGCSSGEDAYCCLKEREQCTQTSGQVNICWGTGVDPVANISERVMNATYSSLSAASPTATFWPVEIAALEAKSSSSASPGSPTSGSNPTNAPSNGLSGGAIGGIVGSIVGGALIVAAILFFLWRRRRIASGPKLVADNFDQDSQQSTGYHDHDPNHGHEMSHYTASAQTGQSEKYAHHANFQSDTAVEAPAYENNILEMGVNHHSVPVELDASSQR